MKSSEKSCRNRESSFNKYTTKLLKEPNMHEYKVNKYTTLSNDIVANNYPKYPAWSHI